MMIHRGGPQRGLFEAMADDPKDTIERWFELAMNAGPAQRPELLQDLERHDASMAAEVAQLVRAHDAEPGFLAQPVSLELLQEAIVSDGVDGFGDRPSTASLIGQSVGGFSIESHLGSGGMSDVYRARQAEPDRWVALKVLRLDSHSRDRFGEEAHVLGRLDHPNIARVYGAGRDVESVDGVAISWIAVEHIAAAAPITAFVAERDLSTEQRVEIFVQVCDAVHHAHRKGVLHRDLKPANLLVARDGDGSSVPKVIDFGLARLIERRAETEDPRTRQGELLGTLHYMSPEQCGGDPDALDVRSDVYSLGVVLFELLSGALPYDVAERPLLEVLQTIQTKRPRQLHSDADPVDKDLSLVVHRALNKVPEDRYDSAAELGEDLSRWLRREPVAARDKAGALYRFLLFARRRAALCAGLVAGALLAVGGAVTIAVLYWQTDRALKDVVEAQEIAAENERLVQQGRSQLERIQRRLRSLGGDGRFEDLDPELTNSIVRGAREAQKQAGTVEEVRSVMAEAIADLDAVSSLLSDDATSRASLAASYRQIATLHGWWWQATRDDAEAGRMAWQRALALDRIVAAERQDDRSAQLTLIRDLTELAQSYRKVQRDAEGSSYADEAIGLARRLHHADPKDDRVSLALVAGLWARSDLHIRLKPFEQGERDAAEALVIAESVLEAEPSSVRAMDDVAWSLLRTGIWARRQHADDLRAFADHSRATDLRLRAFVASTSSSDIDWRANTVVTMFAGLEEPVRRIVESESMLDRLNAIYTAVDSKSDADAAATLPALSWLKIASVVEAGTPLDDLNFDVLAARWRSLDAPAKMTALEHLDRNLGAATLNAAHVRAFRQSIDLR